jgi:hypothetical protein
MLERARIVDTANQWSKGTLTTYQSRFRIIREFEESFVFSVLLPAGLSHPPNGPSIRLMWVQEQYSLYPSEWRKKASALEEAVTFGTVRGLCSAAWDLLQSCPDRLTLGFKDRPTLVQQCSPTEEVAYTYFTEGMKRRMGDHPKPSAVLLLSHMIQIDHHYLDLFRQAPNLQVSIGACRAAVTHLFAYLGWLRGRETFGIRWGDVDLVKPMDGPSLGLPMGIGTLMIDLLPQTKSSQAATADVIMAYRTASGLELGLWAHRLRALLPADQLPPAAFILAHANGWPWTSHFYRYTYLYPVMFLLRSLGDPYLSKYDESPGRELIKAFWSFNTMRRTARSVVAKKRPETLQAATPVEVVEHGRWRRNRRSLDMPMAYLKMSIEDRLCVNVFCQ